jgi:hypothetical protein
MITVARTKGGCDDLTQYPATENGKTESQKIEQEIIGMAKLIAQGYQLLPPGRYVLEVLEAEAVEEYSPQLKVRNRVVEGEYEGFEFVDFPNRGIEGGVKVNTKAWDLFQACLDRPLSPDEELDTEYLIGKRYEAMVSEKSTGKGNRTEHGTIGPHRQKKAEARVEQMSGERGIAEGDDEAAFKDLDF